MGAVSEEAASSSAIVSALRRVRILVFVECLLLGLALMAGAAVAGSARDLVETTTAIGLVGGIAAEKHDAGPAYPSFAGTIDELRLSRVVRYAGPFTPVPSPFVSDPDTVALYHFDEGAGSVAFDSSGFPGGPSDGVLNVGGTPQGPVWSNETPF
ncbi:MAG: hypothetical protein JNL21_04245 [Myxococcales bacterium]|nr:hypothetical protein [Myxococcales bacterium]